MSNHNNRILNTNTTKTATNKCSCRDKTNCPPQGNCLQETVVYKATIKTDTTKKRTSGAQRPHSRQDATTAKRAWSTKAKQNKLSIQYWKHAKQGKTPTITWKIIKKYHPYKLCTKTDEKKSTCKRNIIWYNPPAKITEAKIEKHILNLWKLN